MKRKELLALPVRDWDKVTVYDEVLIIPSGKKHDSGFALMAIIGVLNTEKPFMEIAAYCDDICWKMDFIPQNISSRPGYKCIVPWLRTDMYYPSGIIRHWGMKYEVGHSLSSTDITVMERDKK